MELMLKKEIREAVRLYVSNMYRIDQIEHLVSVYATALPSKIPLPSDSGRILMCSFDEYKSELHWLQSAGKNVNIFTVFDRDLFITREYSIVNGYLQWCAGIDRYFTQSVQDTRLRCFADREEVEKRTFFDTDKLALVIRSTNKHVYLALNGEKVLRRFDFGGVEVDRTDILADCNRIWNICCADDRVYVCFGSAANRDRTVCLDIDSLLPKKEVACEANIVLLEIDVRRRVLIYDAGGDTSVEFRDYDLRLIGTVDLGVKFRSHCFGSLPDGRSILFVTDATALYLFDIEVLLDKARSVS